MSFFTTVDGETIEVDGTAASTWVERTLTGVQSMRVSLEEPDESDESDEGGFTITDGLVRVGRVDQPPYVAERVGSYVDKDVASQPVVEPASEDAADDEPATDELATEQLATDELATDEPEGVDQPSEQPDEQPADRWQGTTGRAAAAAPATAPLARTRGARRRAVRSTSGGTRLG